MASGKAHDTACHVLSILGTCSAVLTQDPTWLFVGIGSLGGLFLSPDLDLQRCNARRRWGWLGWYWWPYAAALKHRSFWSHYPVVGTIGRVAYTSPAWLLLWSCVGEWVVYLLVAGLVIADALHWIMDDFGRKP